jgi:hypothetical protein
MGTPHSSCNTFARRDFMRVPWPAANTITAVSLNSIFLSPCSCPKLVNVRPNPTVSVSDPRNRQGCGNSSRSDRLGHAPSCTHHAIAASRQSIRIAESMADGRLRPPLRARDSSPAKETIGSLSSGAILPEIRLGRLSARSRLPYSRPRRCPSRFAPPPRASGAAPSPSLPRSTLSRPKSTATPAASRPARQRRSNASAGGDSRQIA